MKFCLNKYKLYNVQFMTENGKKEYTSMRERIAEDMYVTLPSVPHNSSSRGLGWATSVNGKNYKKAGTKVKVTKNMKFYPITEKVSGVNLRMYNGDLWRVVSTAGGTATFPSVNLGSGNMCLGWSRTRGKSSAPEFLAGDRIPSKSGNYYMVVFGKHMDKAPSYIRQPEKYDKVIFVGDSRTMGMARAMRNNPLPSIEFIYASGQGINWFQQQGYLALKNKVIEQPKDDKVAVIINLGVNDLRNYSGYTRYMTRVSENLTKYNPNCDMYYMSVNPVNSAMIKSYTGTVTRTEQQIDAINRMIRSTLCSGSNPSYQYINTCSYLQKYGWISNMNNAGIYDGVHYSNETYLRIYDFCMKILNR